MYISNAPWIFWGFWHSVKNLLDPVVRDKVKFINTPADTQGDVPAEKMIEYCGGKVATQFKYEDSKEGENSAQQDTAVKDELLKRHRAIIDKYEEITRAWCKAGGKDDALQEQRDVLQKKLRLSWFELEPYVRGLTVYHRTGVVPTQNRGISISDYEFKGQTTKREVHGRKTCQKSIEQQLHAIVKEGLTVKQAEERTIQALKDGTWGEWKVDDNPEDVKTVARESLKDLGSVVTANGQTESNTQEQTA